MYFSLSEILVGLGKVLPSVTVLPETVFSLNLYDVVNRSAFPELPVTFAVVMLPIFAVDLASRTIYLSSVESYALVEKGYFFEFRNKLAPNVRITKLSFSDEDLKPKYEWVSNWNNHKEIYEKYHMVKRFFTLQEEFLNHLK